MDASVSNCFSPGDRVIVCTAGKFGERWVEIAKAYGLNAVVLEAPYGQVVKPETVAQALAANPDTKGVFVQASETSTGAVHDVRAMGEAVKKTGAIFVVDAITGIGTMPLDIDGWGIDICIGGSQKAFMIPPGLAFMAISPKAWAFMDTAKLPHYYFSLKKERKMAAGGESAWTPNTALMLALAEALEVHQEARPWPSWWRTRSSWPTPRAWPARRWGWNCSRRIIPGSSVTSIKAPKGMDSGVIVKDFRSRFGSIIANGQGTMKGQIFRIAHLGYFDFPDLFAMVAELELILHANGVPVELGTGVAAVQRVYAERAIAKKETVNA